MRPAQSKQLLQKQNKNTLTYRLSFRLSPKLRAQLQPVVTSKNSNNILHPHFSSNSILAKKVKRLIGNVVQRRNDEPKPTFPRFSFSALIASNSSKILKIKFQTPQSIHRYRFKNRLKI